MKRRHAAAAALVAAVAAALGSAAYSGNADRSASDPESSVPAAGSARVHHNVMTDGSEWRFESFRTVQGERCSRQRVPGEGVSVSCFDRAELFRREGKEVLAFPGARQRAADHRRLQWDNLWINGWVSPRVASLDVLNMDCSVVAVPVDAEGAFMHVVGAADIRRGVVPYRLVAHGADGAVVHDQEVAVGLPPNGRDAGLREPRPDAACR